VQIRKWRIKFGIASTALEHAMAQRRAARAASLVPPDVPRGEQPERDGKLQCLQCGRWYRSIMTHLTVHQLDAATYRTRHGLAHRRRLVAVDLVEASRARLTGLLDTPAMQANRADAAQRLNRNREKAIAAAREAAHRPEVIAHRDAARLIANRTRIEQAAQRHDDRARELGHPNLDAFLTATAHLTQREAATLFGVSVSQIGRFRAAAAAV
jgi:predicted transcriptional regulator